MRIGIVGSGHIGGTVGRALAAAGHEVMFSSRHPEQLASLAGAAGPRARTGSVDETTAFAEGVVLAVPGNAAMLTAQGLGLDDRILVDATNQFGQDDSTPLLARALPRTSVVKAFNTLAAPLLGEIDQRTGDNRLVLFTCGDHANAVAVVDKLIEDAGGVAHNLGEFDQAPLMSPGGTLYNREVTAGTLVGVLEGLQEGDRPTVTVEGPEDPNQVLEWLAKSAFGSGFRWQVVENKWPAIKQAFRGFDLETVASMTVADVDQIASDPTVIRNRRKIESVVANARELTKVERDSGGIRPYLTSFPSEQAAAADVAKRFHWIGPETASWFVHSMLHGR